jgi:acetyl esterase
MPLHPQAIEFLNYAAASGVPQLHSLSPEEARAVVDGGEAIGPGPRVAAVEDIIIPVGETEIPARVYRPEPSAATIVWFHGGGWVVGGLESHDAMCRMLANAAGVTVISVAYRLAPEHPFPTPLEDCWDALQWVASQWPSTPLIVGGDSAGGNLATVCALRARDRGGPEVALQVLVYPITDHDMTTASYREHGDENLMLGAKDMAWFFDHYVPNSADRDNFEVSPLRTPDLSGLPYAIVVIDEYDPLRDEGLAYVKRLREAGVEVTLHFYEDMLHVFFQFVNVFKRGDEAVDQVGHDIRAAVSQRPAAASTPEGPV